MEPLCDTPGRRRESEEEHIEYVLAVLQQFGVDTSEIEPDELEEEDFFSELIADGVYLRYRTWKGKPTDQFPNPRVNIEFLGACEYEEDEDETTEDVIDETEDEEEDSEPLWEKNDQEEEEENGRTPAPAIAGGGLPGTVPPSINHSMRRARSNA